MGRTRCSAAWLLLAPAVFRNDVAWLTARPSFSAGHLTPARQLRSPPGGMLQRLPRGSGCWLEASSSFFTCTTITRFSRTTTRFTERSLVAAILLVLYYPTGILVPRTWTWRQLPQAVSQNSFVGESLVIQGSLRSQDLEKQNRTNGLVASGADGFVNHLFSVDYQADSPSYYKTEVFFEYETDSFFEYKTSFFVDKTNSFFEYETGFFVDKTDSFFEYRIDGFVEHSVYCLLAWLVKTMSSSTAPTSGIPLHEYRRDVPPGWGPNIPDYPLKTFFERLKMWYRLYDGPDETVGPLVAGRLTGKAQKLALSLRLPRPDGQVDIGSDALVRLPVDEVRDPANPNVVLQHHIVSGIQALCDKLRETFGHTDQEMASRSLESLFELRRGKLTLQEYAVEFDARMEEAHERAGLEMNEVAHFYFFFKNSGLAPRLVEDIKLQVHGDLRRYQEARSLALRMSSKNENDAYYQDEDASVPPSEQTSWGSSWSTDDGWEDGYDEPSWYEYDETGHEDYYDEEDYWPEEGEGDPADDGDDGADWSYPVKGGKGKRPKGNAMGVGCSVCGSKWHHAASCPVGGKSGKGGFGSKGHEKGNKGGYGKGFRRPWTPKGKGYGKWSPWGSKGSKGKSKGKSKWRGYAEYPDDYNHEKNLAAHFGTDTFAAFPSRSSLRPEVFKMDKDDPEFLGKKSRVTFEDRPDDADDAQDQNHSNQSSKNLAFNFPVTLYADREHFHMIEGHKRRGLLVDPGASNGLIGSETLRDIVDTCLPEKEKKMIQWSSKVANVSGISGAKDQTLGEVTIPIGFGNKDQGTFTADVLGGEGSLCPALLSNPALRKMSSVIYSNFFDNGDGLLACHPRGGEPQGQDVAWSHFRLLLTDSGHYLLPVDRGPNLVSEEAKAKATTFLQSSVDVARKKWKDVRHCFFGARNAELERSEVFFEADEKVKRQEHSVPRDSTEVPEHSVHRDSAEVPEHSVHRDSAEVPEHSVPQVDVNDAAGGHDASPSRSKHPSVRGLFLLSTDDPIQTWHAVDEWTLFGNVLVRHHHRPRRALFTPSCTKDCPVPTQLLSGRRETTWCCDGVTKVFKDSWTKANHPHRDLGQLWTGQTKFYLRDEATSPKTVSSVVDEIDEMPWEDLGSTRKTASPSTGPQSR
ncbi:PLA2G7 [Symbiodinium sp. KB8]|nr:PLA2G7 [Symbiodinium sp. KB8]